MVTRQGGLWVEPIAFVMNFDHEAIILGRNEYVLLLRRSMSVSVHKGFFDDAVEGDFYG